MKITLAIIFVILSITIWKLYQKEPIIQVIQNKFEFKFHDGETYSYEKSIKLYPKEYIFNDGIKGIVVQCTLTNQDSQLNMSVKFEDLKLEVEQVNGKINGKDMEYQPVVAGDIVLLDKLIPGEYTFDIYLVAHEDVVTAIGKIPTKMRVVFLKVR